MPKDWIKKRKSDLFYKKAKSDDFLSRAAYKLLELKKFGIFKNVKTVIDLCSHPGSWIEVLLREIPQLKKIIAVDLKKIKVFEKDNVFFIKADLEEEDLQQKIKELLGSTRAELILSDCSQKLSGDKYLDHNKQLFLAEKSLEIALSFLKPNGNVVIKYFQGVNESDLLDKAREVFFKTKSIKPKASLKNSPEMYLLGLGRK